MRAMAGRAIDFCDPLDAELLPSRRAMRTDAAAAIMVLHHALADPGLLLRHACADLDHDSARLMAADDGVIGHLEAERRRPADRAVVLQIAAAHAGGFDLQHNFPGPRGRIGEVEELDPAVPRENHAFHCFSPAENFNDAKISHLHNFWLTALQSC